MKFFDLELGGLGSMPQRVVIETNQGNLAFVGGTTLKTCKASPNKTGEAYLVYTSENCNGRHGVSTWVACNTKK